MPHDDHGSSHDHAHGHAHGPGHSHAPASFGRAFAIGVSLNLGYVVIEGAYGYLSDSLALLADAGHNLSDVLGLLMAWGAAWLAGRGPTTRRTYGFKATSTLAALANGVLLLLATGAVGWESIVRLLHPAPVQTTIMLWVAAVGVLVNGATALMFMSGRKGDINVRAAFLHMAADALVTLGVIVAALLIRATGWMWLDPAVGLVIAAVILVGTWKLLLDSANLAMDAVPEGIDPTAVRTWLGTLPGVLEVHDLHVWAIGTTDTALTAHLVRDDSRSDRDLLFGVQEGARKRFGIGHATVQLETPEAAGDCLLRPDHVV
jgi:cobalt-zinc-cadmium efflux system protein